MVNSLLARSQFGIVPLIFLLGIGYGLAMVYVNQHHHSLVAVLQIVGGFNLLMLLACSWFSWANRNSADKTALAPEGAV
jgi:hypothetical protein